MQKKRRPIAFYPELAIELGDVESAIYYQQLYYWSDKGSRDDGFVYKTKNEIEFETTLTIRQQDRIRENLEVSGWLETKLIKVNGVPTLHYKALVDLSLNMTKIPIGGYDEVSLSSEYDEVSLSSITENTTHILPPATESEIVACDEDGNPIPLKKKRITKQPLTPRKTLKFDHQGAMARLFDSSIREDRLIALYFNFKGVYFDNAEEMQAQVKRLSRAAKALTGYSGEKIRVAFEYCAKHSDYGHKYAWGLETVLKLIDEANKK